MKVRNQFNRKRYHTKNSGEKHKLFVEEAPLSISEMMRRAQKGIPLSVPVQKFDKITLNDRFYSDEFDILDIALAEDYRLSEEHKKKLKEDHLSKQKEYDDLKAAKAELDRLKTEASKYKGDEKGD